jgi:hypothetical protein
LLRGREADLRGLDKIEVTRVVLCQLWVVTLYLKLYFESQVELTFDLGNIYDELTVAYLFSRQLIGVSLMRRLVSEYCHVAMRSVEVPTYQSHLFRTFLRSQ